MFKIKLIALSVLSTMLVVCAAAQAKTPDAPRSLPSFTRDTDVSPSQARLIKEIRHELVTLPYYDAFDWLEGEVRPDGTVVLRGEVVRPTTKTEAEARVKDIEGIERVVNEIEVLPVSPNDDRIRMAVYRAIFNWDSPLFRYAHRSVPPIHIIVKNGRVTLKGVVATEQESQLAYMKARSVPGVFDVKNELRVEKEAAH
jgi:hyperosmotically inducible periplasmic protein